MKSVKTKNNEIKKIDKEKIKYFDYHIYETEEKMKNVIIILIVFIIGFFLGCCCKTNKIENEIQRNENIEIIGKT